MIGIIAHYTIAVRTVFCTIYSVSYLVDYHFYKFLVFHPIVGDYGSTAAQQGSSTPEFTL